MLNEEITLEAIEEKRREMIRLAIDFGFTSRVAVQASQELDSLLNAATFQNKTVRFSLKKKSTKKIQSYC